MDSRKSALPSLAIVAHDQMKDSMRDWAKRYERLLGRYRLFATGTTGGIVRAVPAIAGTAQLQT